MAKQTRAHTVPRFYLGGFTSPDVLKGQEPFVWLGSIATGRIQRRSPKNVSILRGVYDGSGGLEATDRTIEAHLSLIESEAAFAIRRFAATSPGDGVDPPAAIWRFLCWQAARTPGFLKLAQNWANDTNWGSDIPLVEPPPQGIEKITDRQRAHIVENPTSGEHQEVHSLVELKEYQARGWKWVFNSADALEAMHLQAWYFQVRHFRRVFIGLG